MDFSLSQTNSSWTSELAVTWSERSHSAKSCQQPCELLKHLHAFIQSIIQATDSHVSPRLQKPKKARPDKKGRPGTVRSRSRPGIVEECCFCGCNFAILESYCAAPISNTTNKEEQKS
ncbi:uncharacterized protein LOC122926676 isoform X2 [Bufo gargarizans]|uniref:uncharacterized protein LOC122926676 isoform X2 n=1 Tax=Bufo gargarizans TaxID=30331 RepID=UPI001CF37432|nr:uncharacterized protein LOC122926676 isoform X2 [Bufo gargarizans]